MMVSIHAPVQNTHNIDAVVYREIKYQVLAGWVNTQALMHLIPAFPQFGIVSQFCADVA